ncbi:MAG: tetratricopeptide repeat protein [Bacteroidota bacterium]
MQKLFARITLQTSQKAFLSLFLCLCLTAMDVVPAIAQGPGRAAYLAAENFRKQNKCRDAIEKYNEAINLEPTNYKYYFQMGKCQYKMSDFEAAKNSFQSTVDYKKNFTPAYSLLAKIYKNEKNYDQAIYYYEQAARYESNSNRKVQYQLLLVNLLLKEDQTIAAKRHIANAKQIDPTNPNILFYDGEMASRDGRWQEAKNAYERALSSERLKNTSPGEKAKYYYFLGVALSNLGDAAGAKKAWSKANFGPYKALIAEQMRANNHVYYYKIAVSYYLNGEYNQAESYINQALELQKNFSSGFILKGKIEDKRNNPSRALNYYQQAVSHEKSPARKANLFGMMASMQMKHNNTSGALASLDKALQVNPQGSPKIHYLRAKAQYQSGRFREAATTLEKLLSMGVDTKSKAKYSFMLGMAAKQSADYETARDAFKNAMYGPYKPAAQIELGKLQEKG